MAHKKTQWILILLLWLAGLGAAAQYAKVSAIYDLLGAVYGEAGAALGFAVSLLGLLGVVLGSASGILVARVTYRRALVWALFVGAAASVVQAALPRFELFLLARVVEGLSHLAIVVAAPTLMTALAARHQTGQVMTLWSTFFGVAFALVVFAGRPLVEAGGIPALFLAHAAYMALTGVALALGLPRDTRDQTYGPALSLRDMTRQQVGIYASPWIGAPAIGWLFFTLASIGTLTLLRPFVAPGWETATMVAFPLVSILSAMTLSLWAVRDYGAVWSVTLGFGVCTILSLALLVAPGAPALCLALAAAMGVVQAASFAAVPELNETSEANALAHGAMAQTGNLGNLVGPPVLALAIGVAGGPGFFIGIAIVFAMGGVSQIVLEGSRTLRLRASS